MYCNWRPSVETPLTENWGPLEYQYISDSSKPQDSTSQLSAKNLVSSVYLFFAENTFLKKAAKGQLRIFCRITVKRCNVIFGAQFEVTVKAKI